jgi:hypothetical protein
VARKKQASDLANLDHFQLFDLANAGNETALGLLQARFREDPQLVRSVVNWPSIVVKARLEKTMGSDNPALRLCVEESVRDLASRIAGENPAEVERLLAERIALCWLDVHYHEFRYANLNRRDSHSDVEWRSRMLDHAQKRLTHAIKTLADVRRFPIPAVQVNIAEKQINTLGGV